MLLTTGVLRGGRPWVSPSPCTRVTEGTLKCEVCPLPSRNLPIQRHGAELRAVEV